MILYLMWFIGGLVLGGIGMLIAIYYYGIYCATQDEESYEAFKESIDEIRAENMKEED